MREAGCVIRRVEYMADHDNGFQVTVVININIIIIIIIIIIMVIIFQRRETNITWKELPEDNPDDKGNNNNNEEYVEKAIMTIIVTPKNMIMGMEVVREGVKKTLYKGPL